MSDPVLDASAVLALLNQEPGHEQVLAVLPAASIGTVNLTEVISKLCERGVPPGAALEAVQCFQDILASVVSVLLQLCSR